MTQRSLASLIAVNVVLLAALVMVVLGTPEPASAQFGAGGKYLMIAGKSNERRNQAAVYIIDVNSAKVMSVIVNTSERRNPIEVVAGKSVKSDLQRASNATSDR